jgi:hypothetical protein
VTTYNLTFADGTGAPVVPLGATLSLHATTLDGTNDVNFRQNGTVIAEEIGGGTFNCSWTPSAAGTYTIDVVKWPSTTISGLNTLTITVQPVSTASSLALVASAYQQAPGASTTFTATVTGTGGTPTGTVEFYDLHNMAGGPLGSATLNSSGVATFTTSLSGGLAATQILANYTGDSTFNASFNTVPMCLYSSTDYITVSPSNPAVGQPISITLTTSEDGYWEYSVNGGALGGLANVTTGSLEVSLTETSAGPYSVSFVSQSSASYPVVTVTFQVTASLTSTTTTLTEASNTLTATVSPSGATGTVQFYEGSTALGSPVTLSSGVASYSLAGVTGKHPFSAVYSGDTTHSGSTSATLTEDVQAATTTTLGSSVNPASVGASVTFTATVSSTAATGTVQFYDGSTALGSPVTLSSGVATYSTSALSNATHSITAVYSGDLNYASSTSNAVSQVVGSGLATTTTTLTNIGPVLTASVSPGTATGTVAFQDGTTVLGTATLASGSASFTLTGLSTGTHSITAAYSGDSSNASSTSSALALEVTTVTLAPSLTLTATLGDSSAAGSVSFYNGSTLLGTAALSGGSASLTLSLPQGVSALTAAYSGSESSALSLAVTTVAANTISIAVIAG